jgi:hypothetical protein
MDVGKEEKRNKESNRQRKRKRMQREGKEIRNNK